jgi:hypothetical protein
MVPCMHGMSRTRTRELEPQAASLDAGSPEALGEQPTVGAAAQNVLPARSLNGPSKPLQAANSAVTGGFSDARANLTGRRVDPRAARNPLHAEETEMKMMLDFQQLRERISHLTHDAWNSIVTTTDHLRTTTLNIRRRRSGEPTSASQHQDNRPH